MTLAKRYEINPNIVHDLIEGEVILLNLETGTYYQLTKTAVDVWRAIERGASVSMLAEHLANQYGRHDSEIQQALGPFLQELETELILVPNAQEPTLDAESLPSTLAQEFTPPVLLKYTDMQSLLLLDPIHDVDTPGWPLPKPQDAK